MMGGILTVLLALNVGWTDADFGGPLRLDNELPLAAIFLGTPPLDARIPSRPRLEVRLTAASSFALPDHVALGPTGLAQRGTGGPLDLAALAAEAAADPGATLYFADVETTRLNLLYTRPFGRRFLAEAKVPVYVAAGGWMDRAVDSWHQLFGMADTGRRGFPTGSSQMGYFHGADGITETGQSGPWLGDITLRGLWQASSGGGWPTTALSAAVKIPSGAASRLAGSGAWDAGCGLHLTQPWGRGRFYGTVGANWHGGWRGMSSVDVRTSVDGHLGYEYLVDRRWSVVGQVSIHGSPIRTREGRSIGSPASLYGLAARYRTDQGALLEWGFIENIARSANAHDFGLYGAVRFEP